MNRASLIQWHENHAQRLGAIAAAVLAVLCGLLLARLAWSLVPPPPDAWRPLPVSPVSRESGAGANLERLVAANLFGHLEAPERAEQNVEDAPETRLSLKLLGVYASEDDERSRAIIAASNGDEKSYAIGDTVTRGVTLHSVFADRVVISRSGVLETLRMERDAVAEASAASKADARDASQPVANNAGVISAPDPQELGAIRNELLQNPSKAGNYIRVVPSASGGRQKGYRVYPGRDRSLFAAAGLRPGDLVTAVNGVALDDPARALQLLNELSSASSINVTVERGGTVQNYRLSTN